MKLPEPALVYWNHIDILHPEYRKVTGYTEAQMRQCWNDALDAAAKVAHDEDVSVTDNPLGVQFCIEQEILKLKESV